MCRPKTIRYYEQIGIVPEPVRTPSGYRDYDRSALDRLEFIILSAAGRQSEFCGGHRAGIPLAVSPEFDGRLSGESHGRREMAPVRY